MAVPLTSVTPMILTYNEEANLSRCLERLKWAHRILVVDSFSKDSTLAIASSYPNTQVIQRPFDHFADQCNYGLESIDTEWTLSLDADYLCSPKLADEFSVLHETHSGYRSRFRYCVSGHPLRGTLYPPRIVLYKTKLAQYSRDGHAHRVSIDGSIGTLSCPIDHDDRKPHAVWLQAQQRYASLEADKLLSDQQLGWKDRIRKSAWLAPLLTTVYCLIWKQLLLDGRPGLFYTMQRVHAEMLLAMELSDRRLRQS